MVYALQAFDHTLRRVFTRDVGAAITPPTALWTPRDHATCLHQRFLPHQHTRHGVETQEGVRRSGGMAPQNDEGTGRQVCR